MKSRRLTFRFLVLSVLTAGGVLLLSNQSVKASSCDTAVNSCYVDCMANFDDLNSGWFNDTVELNRCARVCDVHYASCYRRDAWQNWLLQVDLNIGDTFRILDEPDPVCGIFPDLLMGCDSLPTAEEIESCAMGIEQEQARYHCP